MSDIAESLESQIERLALFIISEIEGEPSQSQGAADTAIRIMEIQKATIEGLQKNNQRMVTALKKIQNRLCGNDELRGSEQFYRGYNAVVRDHRKIALEALQDRIL